MAEEGGCGHDREFDPSTCASDPVLALIGRPHTIGILFMLHNNDEPRRFKDFQAHLGAPPKTLSSRLKELVNLKILERTAFAEIPPRVEYSLTERGREMKSFFNELGRWHMKYSMAPSRH